MVVKGYYTDIIHAVIMCCQQSEGKEGEECCVNLDCIAISGGKSGHAAPSGDCSGDEPGPWNMPGSTSMPISLKPMLSMSMSSSSTVVALSGDCGGDRLGQNVPGSLSMRVSLKAALSTLLFTGGAWVE